MTESHRHPGGYCVLAARRFEKTFQETMLVHVSEIAKHSLLILSTNRFLQDVANDQEINSLGTFISLSFSSNRG